MLSRCQHVLCNALKGVVPIETVDYETAARFFNRCRSRGVTGTSIDLLICALAHRLRARIYTTDTDFRRYSEVLGLRLHAARALRRT